MKVFISYRRANGGIAYAFLLYEHLSKLGIDCFFDMEGMKYFSNYFDRRLENEIRESDYVVILLQPGCMKSKNKRGNYYFNEINIASETPEKMIFVTTSNDFNWENEKIPRSLKAKNIDKFNIVTTLDIRNLNNSISNIINAFSLDDRFCHYSFFHRLIAESGIFSKTRIFHQLGDMINIDISLRWNRAKRISLLAMGCSSVFSGDLAPFVHRKFMDNIEFRLIGTNPQSPYIDYIHRSRLNSYTFSDRTIGDYNNGVCSSVKKLISNNPGGKIEYRLTDEVLDYTIQLVEFENDEENYVFIEYIPTKALGVLHRENACVTISRNDSLYDYYVNQFNTIWEEAKVEFKNG